MTDMVNNRNINKNNLTKTDEPLWGNFFGDLLKIICIKYNNVENRGEALYEDIKNIFSISSKDDHSFLKVVESLKQIDPLTLIGYFASSAKASIRQNRLNAFFQIFNPKDKTVIDLFQELKIRSKDIFNNNYILKLTLLDNIKNYKQSMDKLWNFAIELSRVENNDLYEEEKIEFVDSFKKIIPDEDIDGKGINGLKISNLSPIMYLCKPNRYYSLDNTVFCFLKDEYKNIDLSRKDINGFNSICSFKKYINICSELRKLYKTPYTLYTEAVNYSKYLSCFNEYFYSYNNKPVCREERQYALFLYNRLLNMVDKEYKDINDEDKELFKKIFGKELNNSKILRVYYEVSFLRDFFKKGRDELKNHLNFNKKLYDYVLDIFYNKNCKYGLSDLFESIDYYSSLNKKDMSLSHSMNIHNFEKIQSFIPLLDKNYGSIEKDSVNYNDIPYFMMKLMQTMMNSKPDIGIIYEKNGNKYLKFIECKYVSKESPVHLLNIKCDNKDKSFRKKSYILRQTQVQYYIADFICRKLIGESKLKADMPLLLNFILSNKKKRINKKEKRNNIIDKALGSYYFDFKIETASIKISDLLPNCFEQKLFD